VTTEDEARRIHEELTGALGAVAEHGRVSARVERARAAEEPARQAVAEARAELAEEQDDVRRLESFSTARIWATLKGSRDTDLDREQAEQQAAEYAVAKAEAWLAGCREETERAAAELARLGDVAARRERALAAKEQWLRDAPGPAGVRLAAIAATVADLDAEATETREAIAAGKVAAGALEKAQRMLGSAGGWATYDTFFGGGMFTDAMKYSRMDDAQRLLHAADRALRTLRAELADVGVHAVVADLRISGLTQAFDVWFDNIFSDWSVRDRISRASARTDEAARVVHEIRVRLARRAEDLERRRAALADERDALLTA
jgi:hypothetical protein